MMKEGHPFFVDKSIVAVSLVSTLDDDTRLVYTMERNRTIGELRRWSILVSSEKY
jgi:hypothetical protein